MDKNSSAYKAVLLSVVCAVAGLLLSSVNKITKPIIDANSLKAVQGTLEEFFPDGEFEDVTSKYKTDEYDKVEGIYEAKGEGYVFTLTGQGYSSDGFKFAIAFDNDGKIVGYKGLESNETQGKGSKAFDDDYADQVKQLTSTDAMPLISGATITTTAVGESVTQAEEIFNNIQGISFDADAAKPAAPEAAKAEVLGQADFSSRKASCEDKGDGVYACKAAGFASDLQATITVKDGKVDSITDVSGSENGDGVGDDFFSGRTDSYKGKTLDDEMDLESGATNTSQGVAAMVQAALKAASGESAAPAASAAAGNTLGTEDYSSAKAEAKDNGDGTFACTAQGFSGKLTATITVKDGKIVSITDLDGADDGDGVGDDYFKDGGLKDFEGATLDSSIDGLSGATYTSNAVKGMAAAALKAAK